MRAATEAVSCLESESLISPAIIPRPLSQRKRARLPQLAHPHSPRTGAAPAALAAYWKSPCVKQCGRGQNPAPEPRGPDVRSPHPVLSALPVLAFTVPVCLSVIAVLVTVFVTLFRK